MIHLYVKQHSVTGMKYFGKTEKNNPVAYLGSGKYWLDHIKKHGMHIKTVELWSFTDPVIARKFAIQYSLEHDIVVSQKWANLKIEELDGGDTSECEAYKAGMKNRDTKGDKNPMYGRSAVKENNLKWYNNGQENIYVTEHSEPKGFYRGRIGLTGNPRNVSSRNKQSNSKLKKGKRVVSPDGIIFDNRQAAALFANCKPSAMTERIKRGKSGWRFLT